MEAETRHFIARAVQQDPTVTAAQRQEILATLDGLPPGAKLCPRLIKQATAARILSVSRTTFWQMRRDATAAGSSDLDPVYLGPNSHPRWPLEAIEALARRRSSNSCRR